jgi:hypothetical protein
MKVMIARTGTFAKRQFSVHPETPDDANSSFQFINEQFASSRPGTRSHPLEVGSRFAQGQENQGIARRRTEVRRTRNPEG